MLVYSSNKFFSSHNAVGPPDSIPNSEVKCCYADGSVGDSHVRVGHRQVYSYEPLM